MADKMGKWPFLTHVWANFPFFGHFWALFLLFPGGAKIRYSAVFFFISGPKPEMGSVQGNRGRARLPPFCSRWASLTLEGA